VRDLRREAGERARRDDSGRSRDRYRTAGLDPWRTFALGASIARQPGLELATTGVHWLTGLPLVGAQILVVLLARSSPDKTRLIPPT